MCHLQADRVSVDELGGQPCTTFVRDSLEQTKVSTIILRASTSNHLDDLSRAIDNGVNIYKQVIDLFTTLFSERDVYNR